MREGAEEGNRSIDLRLLLLRIRFPSAGSPSSLRALCGKNVSVDVAMFRRARLHPANAPATMRPSRCHSTSADPFS